MRKWGTFVLLLVFTMMHSIVGNADASGGFSNRTQTSAGVHTESFILSQNFEDAYVECCDTQMLELDGLFKHSPLECKLLISMEPACVISSSREHFPSNPEALEKRETHILFRPPII